LAFISNSSFSFRYSTYTYQWIGGRTKFFSLFLHLSSPPFSLIGEIKLNFSNFNLWDCWLELILWLSLLSHQDLKNNSISFHFASTWFYFMNLPFWFFFHISVVFFFLITNASRRVPIYLSLNAFLLGWISVCYRRKILWVVSSKGTRLLSVLIETDCYYLQSRFNLLITYHMSFPFFLHDNQSFLCKFCLSVDVLVLPVEKCWIIFSGMKITLLSNFTIMRIDVGFWWRTLFYFHLLACRLEQKNFGTYWLN